MAEAFIFQVSPSSGVPIYKQLIDQIESMIAGGRLKPGDMLPSVRQISEELEINPMTVSKAYMLLENQGALQRLRGQGMIVAERKVVPLPTKRKLERLKPTIMQLVTLAHQLNLPEKEVIQYLKFFFKDDTDDDISSRVHKRSQVL